LTFKKNRFTSFSLCFYVLYNLNKMPNKHAREQKKTTNKTKKRKPKISLQFQKGSKLGLPLLLKIIKNSKKPSMKQKYTLYLQEKKIYATKKTSNPKKDIGNEIDNQKR